MLRMKLIQWYSRQKMTLNEVGDKIDANDKAAVQADIDALKAVIAEITDDQNITDAQIESLKNGKRKINGKLTESILKDV